MPSDSRPRVPIFRRNSKKERRAPRFDPPSSRRPETSAAFAMMDLMEIVFMP
jgi:hypothetical protein